MHWGRDGTYLNNPTLAQAGALIEPTNRAVRLNGSTQKIAVPFDSALNTSAFTVEVWCKVTGGMGNWRSPLTSRDDNPTRGFNFYAGTDNRWQFWTGNGSSSGWTAMTGPAIDTNQWVQLVGVVNGNFQSFYVNGVLAASAQAAFSPNTAKALTRLSQLAGGFDYFQGFGFQIS